MGTAITCSSSVDVFENLHEIHQLATHLRHKHIENLHVRHNIDDVLSSVPLNRSLRPRLKQCRGPHLSLSASSSSYSWKNAWEVESSGTWPCTSSRDSLLLPWSWWLSSVSVGRRASGVAPKPGSSGSPSVRGARTSTSCALAAHERHQRVRHATTRRPLDSRPKRVSQNGNTTWLSLLLLCALCVVVSGVLCVCLLVCVWCCVLLLCMSLWSWSVRAVWCGTLKTPCVHSKRARVYGHQRGVGGRERVSVTHTHTHQRQHTPTHTLTPTRGTPTTHTQRTTHKRTNAQHARWHRQFCIPKIAHVKLSPDPRGSPEKPLYLTRFQFEHRSRTTCSRFLQSFALHDKVVQLQLS